jgi:hypothetical protein
MDAGYNIRDDAPPPRTALNEPHDEGQPPSPPAETPFVPLEAEKASTPLDRARILHEVMRYVVRVTSYSPVDWPQPRVWIPVTCFLSIMFAMYSWAARPQWIWGPQIDPDVAIVEHDADMRFAMYLLAQRVFEYRREFGAVPDAITAVGDAIPGVRYQALSDTSFVLRYERNNPIILHSWDSMDDFLRSSLDVVKKPRRR